MLRKKYPQKRNFFQRKQNCFDCNIFVKSNIFLLGCFRTLRTSITKCPKYWAVHLSTFFLASRAAGALNLLFDSLYPGFWTYRLETNLWGPIYGEVVYCIGIMTQPWIMQLNLKPTAVLLHIRTRMLLVMLMNIEMWPHMSILGWGFPWQCFMLMSFPSYFLMYLHSTSCWLCFYRHIRCYMFSFMVLSPLSHLALALNAFLTARNVLIYILIFLCSNVLFQDALALTQPWSWSLVFFKWQLTI